MHTDIVPFKPQFSKDFYNLNIEWLRTHFYVEPIDEEVLGKPEQYIIDKGGYIFFLLKNEVVVGTAALMSTNRIDTLELTKMAVSPNQRGYNFGQRLLQHCITFALENDIKKLILYSNTILENAIHIYRKYGFKEIPVEVDSPYLRSNIKMELNLK